MGLACWLLLGSAAKSAGGVDGKPLLPAAELTTLVKHDAKAIEDILSKGEPDKKSKRKVKAAAFMIAAYAQFNATKENASQMAGIREAALSLLKEFEAGNFKEALALAKAIPGIKNGPKAGIKPLDLNKAIEFADVMHQYSSERVGGYGIEKILGDFAEEKLTPAKLEQLGTLAYKLAAIGQVSMEFKDDKEEGGMKTVKNWVAQAEQFRKLTLELATAARAKNVAGAQAALEKVSSSCVKCHDIFR